MSETSYSVSETAKLLDVQSHVLRFWEDELHPCRLTETKWDTDTTPDMISRYFWLLKN